MFEKTIKPEKETIQFKEWPVELVRRAYRQKMTLKVMPGPQLRLLTNKSQSLAEIEKFLLKSVDWIEDSIEEMKKHPAPKSFSYADGELLFSGGVAKRLSIQVVSSTSSVTEMDSEIIVRFKKNFKKSEDISARPMQVKKLLKKYFATKARAVFTERVQFWSQEMQISPRGLKIKSMKSRWGSCSSQKNINLNLKLIATPLWVLDSVIIHELGHLKHSNHSSVFYAFIDQYDMRRRDADLWLKKNSPELDFL